MTKKPKKAAVPSLFRSASLIAVVTVVSKILGLLRDQVMAHAYGAGVVSDAYNYAFQIPSFALVLLGGLGGPFHTATVSVLAKLTKDTAPPSAQTQQLVNTFVTVTGVVATALALIVLVFAPQIIGVIAHEASPDLKAIAVLHLRWMTPMIILGSIIGIFYGIANIYHRFFWSSLSPSAINITLILWIWFLGPDDLGLALAISTMLGAVLQVLLQLPDYITTGFRYKPAWQLQDKDLKTMGELLFPATIGTTIGQLNIYTAMFFASLLPAGGWTAITLGNRLIQLPIGVLIIAMLVPLFPRFSRLVADQDFDSLRNSFRDGILTLWLLSLPIMALIFLVGTDGVALLFQRGEFNAEDTHMVSTVLVVLSVSMLPYMLRDGITRIFYAFNDSKTPLIAGLSSIGINVLFNFLLVKPFGIGGIAMSTVIVSLWNATLLCLLVRKHIPSMGFGQFVSPTFKMILAAIVAFAAGYLALQACAILYAYWQLKHLHLISLINILAALITVGGVYGVLLIILRVTLVHRVTERLLKRRASS